MHLDPNVREPGQSHSGACEKCHSDHRQYLPFVWLMNHAWLILTDSGGIQATSAFAGETGAGDARYH
ncbi:hypothetical protein ACLB1E_05300 [Escherichia coli]